jgi:hypothetical protein
MTAHRKRRDPRGLVRQQRLAAHTASPDSLFHAFHRAAPAPSAQGMCTSDLDGLNANGALTRITQCPHT